MGKTLRTIAKEWGVHPTEVSAVALSCGQVPTPIGNALVLTPEQERHIEPQLRLLKEGRTRLHAVGA